MAGGAVEYVRNRVRFMEAVTAGQVVARLRIDRNVAVAERLVIRTERVHACFRAGRAHGRACREAIAAGFTIRSEFLTSVHTHFQAI